VDLSIIIVCYKGWERLTKCLEALDSFSGDYFSMEVIVINNNPGDTGFKEVESRFTGFRFINNSVNGGYSHGCNLGAANASGEYLLILNPDTLVADGTIQQLLDVAKSDPSFYIVSCRQVKECGKESKAYGDFPWKRKESDSFNAEVNPEAKNRYLNIVFPDWISGSVMMLRKDIFIKLNGFDEDFWMYYEDVDLCRRARNAGGRIAFCNDITIEHNHGGSTREDLRITSIAKCEVQISRHLYINKHESGIRRTLIQVITVTDNLFTGIITGLTGLLFFFIPELFVRFLVCIRVVNYYAGTLLRRSWISPRSVNYRH